MINLFRCDRCDRIIPEKDIDAVFFIKKGFEDTIDDLEPVVDIICRICKRKERKSNDF